MSDLTNNHTFLPFDSKTSAALAGQRLIKILYKTPSKGDAPKKQSMCVSVPKLDAALNDAQLARLVPHIEAMLEAAQDGIARDVWESKAMAVTTEQLSIDACIDWLDSESQGDRLTSEKVKAWFAESIADTLAVAFIDKLGFGDSPDESQLKKVGQAVNVYCDKFASMAGGKTSFAPDVATKLLDVLELIPDQDVGTIGARFKVRLAKMKTAADDMLLAL